MSSYEGKEKQMAEVEQKILPDTYQELSGPDEPSVNKPTVYFGRENPRKEKTASTVGRCRLCK